MARVRMASVLALFLAALVAGGLAGCSGDDTVDTTTQPAQRIEVPNLAGLDASQAVKRLCAAGLSVGQATVVARTQPVSKTSTGSVTVTVRATVPKAGEQVPAGTKVDLRLASPANAATSLLATCESGG